VAEPERPKTPHTRMWMISLGLVLACGAVLRLWAVGSRIPFGIGQDEPAIMMRVLRMMRTGDFNPHFFDYPGLYIHVQLVVAVLRFLTGAFNGAWHSLQEVDAGDFYLWGRITTAALGTATVWLVYRLGTRWGAWHALLAAATIALLPGHVRESHYVLTDVPMTFLTTLTLLLTFRAHEKKSLASFMLAGAAAGLATATKYNGLVAAFMPLAAIPFTSTERPRVVVALAVIGSTVAAFLIGAPYTILDLPGFLNAFGYLTIAGGPADSRTAVALTYLKHVRAGLGWPGVILLACGIGLGSLRLVTGPERARYAPLLVFLVAYFYLVSGRSLVFARYLMPLWPLAALLIAIGTVEGATLLRRLNINPALRTALIVGLAGVLLWTPAATSIGFVRLESRESTTESAGKWILAHVPKGARIAVEAGSPWLPEQHYRIDILRRVVDREPAQYVADGFDYVIATSQVYRDLMAAAEGHPAASPTYRRLFESMPASLIVRPSALRPGPEIVVLKVPR
jgi:4-amino-4-deoxy-L-arabinose transferase-like glycosyltransferase